MSRNVICSSLFDRKFGEHLVPEIKLINPNLKARSINNSSLFRTRLILLKQSVLLDHILRLVKEKGKPS